MAFFYWKVLISCCKMPVVTVLEGRLFFTESQTGDDDHARFATRMCIDDFVDEFQFTNARASNDTRVSATTLRAGAHALKAESCFADHSAMQSGIHQQASLAADPSTAIRHRRGSFIVCCRRWRLSHQRDISCMRIHGKRDTVCALPASTSA